MIRIILVLVPVAAATGGYLLGRSRVPQDPRIAVIKHHAKLLRKCRWASITRRPGLANIYAEAAEDVMSKLEPRELRE